MKDPTLAYDIVSAIKQVIQKPLTVKIRTGWDENHKNAVAFAKMLEKAGADAIAIHGRTRSKMYSGAVDLQTIADVKAAVSIPVIGNGDVVDGPSAKNMLEKTKVDAIMLARAVWGQPWIVKEVIDHLNGNPYYLSLQERFAITIEHALALIDLKGEKTAIKEMRSHGTMALKGYPHSHRVKEKIANASTFDEFASILDTYLQHLQQEGLA